MELQPRNSILRLAGLTLCILVPLASLASRGGDKSKSSSSSRSSGSSHSSSSHSSGGSHTSSSSRSSGSTHSSRASGSTSSRSSRTSSSSDRSYSRKTHVPNVSKADSSSSHSSSNHSEHTASGNGSAGKTHGTNRSARTRPGTDRTSSSGNSREHTGSFVHATSTHPAGAELHTAGHSAFRRETNVGDRRVARDEHGRVRDIHGHDVYIHHGVRGDSRFVATNNGRRIVGYGAGRGFTERRYYSRGDRIYVQRTYIFGGRPYAYAYRSYYYRGWPYYHYVPAYYYHPFFYRWAFNPWGRPVYYHWGWFGDPWYRGYGYYFNPYPVYPSASLWLTDYLLAENLRAAYEARPSSYVADTSESLDTPAAGGQAALSPEVKQLIADEVQRQLDAERAAAAQPAAPSQLQETQQPAEEVPAALDPKQKIFIVGSNLDLVSDAGECAVTPGDVLLRTGSAPDANNKVSVSVLSSKKGDCPVDTTSDVEVTELQEMHNQFREKMDTGLKSLAENQGKNGLPQAPTTETSAGEVPPPTADAEAETELQSQQKNAEQEEQTVQNASSNPDKQIPEPAPKGKDLPKNRPE